MFNFFSDILKLFSSLKEVNKNLACLNDHILWAGIEDGVVFSKDLSMQITFNYRKPDLSGANEEEIVDFYSKINDVLKELPTGWVLHTEVQRVFKRQELLKSDKEVHFESIHYLTLQYIPFLDIQDIVKKLFMEGTIEKLKAQWEKHWQFFLEETEKIAKLLESIFGDGNIYKLPPDETMTYLYSTVSDEKRLIKAPKDSMYIDSYLKDLAFLDEEAPQLGNQYIRVVSLLGYPGRFVTDILVHLNTLNFEYRLVNRFIFLSEEDAQAETQSYQKSWFESGESMGQYINEKISGNMFSHGYYNFCIVVIDENKKEAKEKVEKIASIINKLEFTTVIETSNPRNTWLGTLPGMPYYNKYKPQLDTDNIGYMMPVSPV